MQDKESHEFTRTTRIGPNAECVELDEALNYAPVRFIFSGPSGLLADV